MWRRVYRERRAIALPLVVILGANLALLALAVLPLKQNVSSLQGQRSDAAHNLDLARLSEQRAKEQLSSKQTADKQLRQFYAETLPANYSSASKLVGDFFQGRARETGLIMQRTQAELEDVKDSRLKRVVGKVTLRGDYPSIRKFLYEVETAEEFVIIDRMALAQATDARSSNTGALEITLNITTYYLPPGAR